MFPKYFRFSVLESDPKVSCLFMLTNAIGGRKMGKNPAQIQLWNPGRGLLVKHAEFKEDLSALTVRNDGRFVAVGTRLGSVYILTSFNLKVLSIFLATGKFTEQINNNNLLSGCYDHTKCA